MTTTTRSPVVAPTGLRHEVRTFLAEERAEGRFTPAVDSWVGGVDLAFSRALGARGWVGMATPHEFGGGGRSAEERWVVTEELLAAGAPVAAHWIADRQIAPSLIRNGSPAQRERFLPRIISGGYVFCLGMSEPDAGSDLASVRTRATRTPDGWVLDGTKIWTTHAQVADAMVLLARSAPGSERHAGLSQFLVELPQPGVTVRPISTIDGDAHFNEVVFDGALVGPEALLGVEGEGWAQVTAELAYERSGPERFMSSVPLLLAWGDRLRSGDPDPVSHEAYARLVARLTLLRRMSRDVARALDAGRTPDVQAAMVKELGGRFEQEVVDVVATCTGIAPDLSSDDPLAVMLGQGTTHRPTFTLRGGAGDVLRGIVAKGGGVR